MLDEITASVRRANANAAGDRGWGSAANLGGIGAAGSEEREEDGGVDAETRAAVAADAAAAAELLRHFWLAAPMVTAVEVGPRRARQRRVGNAVRSSGGEETSAAARRDDTPWRGG